LNWLGLLLLAMALAGVSIYPLNDDLFLFANFDFKARFSKHLGFSGLSFNLKTQVLI
jgi:hypothetical protein